MTTPKKKVAATLTSILENPIMASILDKSHDIDETINEVVSWWRYDMASRKPGIAYTSGGDKTTDLDLSCFLFELAERNAVINIPIYKSIRAKSIKEGEFVLSSQNRHVNVLGLSSNKDVFSFSLRIKDMNAVSTDNVGAFRNFSITDFDGDWYPGFGNLEFIPTAEENEFIFKNNLADDGKINFSYFVHPNRWQSFFGQYYFMTKVLIDRMKEEAQYYNSEIKTMLAEGINYPIKSETTDRPSTEKIPGKKIKVKSFEVEIDLPENDSQFEEYKHNAKNLVILTDKRKYWIYNLIPKLNFAVRTVEYAYFKHGDDRIPSWIKNVKWETGYITKGKRTAWDRLVLFQNKVGEVGVSIKKRVYETIQEVALDYDNRKGKLKNYIAIVLDESGSMGLIWSETINTFNEQIQVIKKNSEDMETMVSLQTFNTTVPKPRLWNVSDSKLQPISIKDYKPDGMTALHDAIGRTITELKKTPDADDPTVSFLLIIISDGEENHSKYPPLGWKNNIAPLIKEIQSTGKWTVTYLGANQDLVKVSDELGIAKGNLMKFDASSKGMKEAGFTVSMGLNNFYDVRRKGNSRMDNFYGKKP